MKVRSSCYVVLLLSALVLTASVPPAYAQKAKGAVESLPQVVKGPKKPRTSLPKQTLGKGLGKDILSSSHTPSKALEQATTQQITRATTQETQRASQQMAQAAKQASQQAAKLAKQGARSLLVQSTPATASTNPHIPDTGTNLTGTQVLAHYYPTWRDELGAMFSNEQLDAVEKAFAQTDEWMFVRGEDGELKARNKDEWDYEARFLTLLTRDSGVSFTDKQIKQLIGGRNIQGFTFKIYFFRMRATGFSCAKGTKPRTVILRNGHKLPREEMTPEEVQEVIVGNGLAAHRNHPLIQAYMQENRLIAKKKTPEEYVALARQYPTKPRSVIYRGGHRISREEMTPEEVQEVIVGKGLERYSNHPLVQAYRQENRLKAEKKTPEEYVALAKQYPTKPRASIYRDGHLLSREEMTPEEVQEVIIGKGINTHRNHPLVQAYRQENRLIAEKQTTQQLYTALTTHIKEYGHYPTWAESPLYINVYSRLRRHQSTMTADGKYADPWLQKIYELKNFIQNAPEGKFTFTPDGQGGYTLEIEEPVTEELDETLSHTVEEVAPAVPTEHTLYRHITEETKNLILSVRDHAALERREFYPWLRRTQQNNLSQIVNKTTLDSLYAVSRAIAFDYKAGQSRRVVTRLLNTINNYVGILGKQEDTFYKLIYRGELKEGILPQSNLFHVVAEQKGMSWNGTLAPQVDTVNRTYAQAIKHGETPSVYLDGDEDMVTAIGILPRVDIKVVKQELEAMLEELLPPGFSVRMGLHELGINGSNLTRFQNGYVHLHLERPATAEEIEDGFWTDVSISLDVKVSRFAGWWDPNVKKFYPYSNAVIAQRYRTLFDKFLDQEAKDKLSELAR